MDEETESQQSVVTWLKSRSQEAVMLEFEAPWVLTVFPNSGAQCPLGVC